MAEIEHRFFIVTFDRKNFLENSLQPLVLPLRGSDILL